VVVVVVVVVGKFSQIIWIGKESHHSSLQVVVVGDLHTLIRYILFETINRVVVGLNVISWL